MSKRFRPSRPAGRLLRPRSSRPSAAAGPITVRPTSDEARENVDWKDEPSNGEEVRENGASLSDSLADSRVLEEALASAEPIVLLPDSPETVRTTADSGAAAPTEPHSPKASTNAQAGNAQTGNAQADNAQTGNAQAGNAQAGDAQAGDAQAGDAPQAIADSPRNELLTQRDGKKKKKKSGQQPEPAVVESSAKHTALTDSAIHRAVSADDPAAEEFFSVLPPPVVEDHEEHVEPPPPPPSKAVVERQRRARKIVGGVVAAASLVVLFGLGRALFSGKPAGAQASATQRVASQPGPTDTAVAAALDTPNTVAVASTAAANTAASQSDSATATATVDASAAASASASAPTAEAPDAEAGKVAGALSPDDLKALKKKAETALNRGENKVAIEASLEALQADPGDALIYLFLGSAHMNMGKMKEAKQAFDDCARNAKGHRHYGECIQMGGKK